MLSEKESTGECRGLNFEGHVIRFCKKRLMMAAALAAYLNDRLHLIAEKPAPGEPHVLQN